MKRLKPLRWASVLALAVAATRASAQEADTLSISGTFRGYDGIVHSGGIEYPGMLGDDLAEVYANRYEHAWTLTLHGVSYSHDYVYQEWNDERGYGFNEQYITCVSATSFDLQFFGPDADILNAVVSQQWTWGTLELSNGFWWDSSLPEESGPYSTFGAWASFGAGVSFFSGNVWSGLVLVSTDADGYPDVEPQRLQPVYTVITDQRPGNKGGLFSEGDFVDIGSSEPPVLPPPPPPPPPTLSIADGSVREGKKGTSRLDLTVTLSRSISDAVTVNYATASGTAVATSDYTAASGTLTFQPGQTSGTVSIAIKGDRKREKNETFSVQLSNVVGANIADGVATVTILNDD